MSKTNSNPSPNNPNPSLAMNYEDRVEVSAARILKNKHDEFEVEYNKEKATLDAKYQNIYYPLFENGIVIEIIHHRRGLIVGIGIGILWRATKDILEHWTPAIVEER
nr:nucleosome assembly protein 1;3-like [Ipomoea trifida]